MYFSVSALRWIVGLFGVFVALCLASTLVVFGNPSSLEDEKVSVTSKVHVHSLVVTDLEKHVVFQHPFEKKM